MAKQALSQEEQLQLKMLKPQLRMVTEEFQRIKKSQQALLDISDLSSSALELNQIYPKLHSVIGNMMNADNFCIVLWDKSTDCFEFAYVKDEFEDLLNEQLPDHGLPESSLTRYLMRQNKPLLLSSDDVEQLEEEQGVQVLGEPAVDWMGIPLNRGQQVIGALVVQSYDEAVRYDQTDLDFLIFVSQHIVSMIDRVRHREVLEKGILERTQQLQKLNSDYQMEIAARQKSQAVQAVLFEISELSATVQSIDDFYPQVHESLKKLMMADNCCIAICDDNLESLAFPYYVDELEITLPEANYPASRPFGQGLTEHIIRTGKSVLLTPEDVETLIRNHEIERTAAVERFIEYGKEWLGIPMNLGDAFSGALILQNYDEDVRYSQENRQLLKYVTRHIAETIMRRRTADSLQAQNKELEETVIERTRELHEAVVAQQKINEVLRFQNQQIAYDAAHDSLTGLSNRSKIIEKINEALRELRRTKESNYAVLFIDLDKFKLINDTLGHHAGDEFLVEVSERLSRCIRENDTLARLGGDEFVILLKHFNDVEDCEEIAGRIIESLRQPFELDSQEIHSGASIGITLCEGDYQNADEVLRDADAAMYHAKNLGRGRFVLFDSSMHDKLVEELALETELRHAIRDEELSCFFEPVCHLQTQDVIGYEALVRWEHPKKGELNSDAFLRIADDTGLIKDIDLMMLKQVCDVLRQWRNAEDDYKNMQISLNLSVKHLAQIRFAQEIISVVKESGISPYRLILEFDERKLNQDSDNCLASLKLLKKAGIRLALDNFGSGLAALRYLYSYPFDFIKIDRRFVKSVVSSKENLKMIETIRDLGVQNGYVVLAAGIENQKQAGALLSIGCEFGQGKLLGKPQQLVKVDSLSDEQQLTA